MKSVDNFDIVKSNKLVEAGYRLNLDEQRLILSSLTQIKAKTDIIGIADRFRITAKEFSVYSGVDLKSSYQQLESAAQNLFERRLSFYDTDTNDLLTTRWVSSVKYNDQKGFVELCFAQDVIPLLTQINHSFTQYKLEVVSSLNSAHAIRTYELSLQYLATGIRIMTVEEYKYFLGIEDLYEDYKRLNARVLKPSIEQINKHTDIKIKVTPLRENRKITSLKFEIESKKPSHHKASKQKTESELKKLSQSLNLNSKPESKKNKNQPTFHIPLH
jgi:plasmid replication initiation protein